MVGKKLRKSTRQITVSEFGLWSVKKINWGVTLRISCLKQIDNGWFGTERVRRCKGRRRKGEINTNIQIQKEPFLTSGTDTSERKE